MVRLADDSARIADASAWRSAEMTRPRDVDAPADECPVGVRYQAAAKKNTCDVSSLRARVITSGAAPGARRTLELPPMESTTRCGSTTTPIGKDG
jgi:hypothetical protein